MLGPKTTSSAAQLKKSAMAARASAITCSVARLVIKAPPAFALMVAR
jgi:hypothetical protein